MILVQSGRVSVNGQIVTEPSRFVGPDDEVVVDGKTVKAKVYTYLVLNKPKGYVTTRADRYATKTVLDLLPAEHKHLNPVGRLDKDTEGLLILTNDGELAHQLMHPRFHLEKVYWVKVRGHLTPDKKNALETGVMIDGHKTAPARVNDVHQERQESDFLLTIHEGRKRQVRLMTQAVGCPAVGLKRVAQGSIRLGALPAGKYRLLTNEEVLSLRAGEKKK